MQTVDVSRKLWRQCFHDPQYYEDFYFETVWPKNHVYLSEEKGMLHLNPYPNYIHGKTYELHYIVGVATDERYRRQGVMTFGYVGYPGTNHLFDAGGCKVL